MAMSFPEAAAHFLGYGYAFTSKGHRNVVPVIQAPLPRGLLWTPGKPRRVDCSTGLAAMLAYAHAGLVDWDEDAYRDMQIMGQDLWSPVDCWARHGLGRRLDEGVAAPGWGAYQSWVDAEPEEVDGDPISGGHQWAYHGAMGVRVHSSSRGRVGPTWERVPFAELVERYDDGVRGVALELIAA